MPIRPRILRGSRLLGSRLLGLLLGAVLLVASGCQGLVDAGEVENAGRDAGGPETYDSGLFSGCVSNERFFSREVWTGTLQTQCLGCHNPQGVAAASQLVLQNVTGRPDAMETNYQALVAAAERTAPGESEPLLLQKPLGELAHGGGAVIVEDSVHFERLSAFVERLSSPVVCEDQDADFFDGVELESVFDTLRRFAILFAYRLPTTEEIARVDAGGEEALSEIIGEMMDEEAFADRVAEGFNDILLTSGTRFEIAQIGTINHPNLLWFRSLPEEEQGPALSASVDGVSFGASALIKNIVQENEPFTNLLLADYAMVNPQAARSLDVFDSIDWADPNDPLEFRKTVLHFRAERNPYPHAGMLNTYIYLRRYPSTETNLNRARARAFLLHFLGTDILEFAPLTSDPLAIAQEFDNPVRDAPDCAVCHVVVDSIAGVFHNYQGRSARYEGGVPTDTFPAGFQLTSPDGPETPLGERTWTGGLLPADRDYDSLRWLAEQTVSDPRFASTMVKHFFGIVLGRPALEAPSGPPSLERDGAFRAFEVQQDFLRELTERFVESNYDTKAVVRAVVLSPFFRARRQTESTPELDAMRFDLGSAQLLTPEQLHRKIIAIFGDAFQTYPSFKDALMDFSKYRILYGGVDSNEVTERLMSPNGLMAGVQQLIANNVSCRQASREFDRPVAERVLLSGTELSEFGPAHEAAIRETLVHLHLQVLGERVSPNDVAIDRSYGLFRRVQGRGVMEIANRNSPIGLGRPCEAGSITDDPDYVVRAWAAVLNYQMQTFEFLYQ